MHMLGACLVWIAGLRVTITRMGNEIQALRYVVVQRQAAQPVIAWSRVKVMKTVAVFSFQIQTAAR